MAGGRGGAMGLLDGWHETLAVARDEVAHPFAKDKLAHGVTSANVVALRRLHAIVRGLRTSCVVS